MTQFRNYLSRLRYNYYFSKTLVLITSPIFRLCIFFDKLISKKIKVNGASVDYAGIRLNFPANVGINICTKIYWHGQDGFESLTGKTFLIFFKRFEIFIDIGSNFGFYSVVAQRLNTNIKTFCFEPLPNIYIDNLNFHIANTVSNQRIYKEAISDFKGEVKFFVPNVYSIASEITSASIERDFFYNQIFERKEIVVESTTLDNKSIELKNEWSNKRIVVKIDVEGHEKSVFDGGMRFFNEYRPFIIVEIDMTGSKAEQLMDVIHKLDYSLFAITPMGYFRLERNSISTFIGSRDFLLIPNEFSLKINYYSFDSLSLNLN